MRLRAETLHALGLGRPELRAWALYDWANSAFFTTVVAAVFPVYFSSVAAADLPPSVATARYAAMTTLALVLIAVCAPILGAWADFAAIRKKLLAVFLGFGVCATAGMGWIYPGDWQLAAGLFIVANIGVSGSMIFYDSLLPHIATDDEIDRVSTAGYALGYLGGGLLLALNLAWIQFPEWFGIADAAAASRLSFVSVAVWWLVFSIPLFRQVVEPASSTPPHVERHGTPYINPPGLLLRGVVGRLRQSIGEFRVYKNAGLLLLAFVIYNDGVGTIIRMAAIYGTEIGLSQSVLISAILLVQFIGMPAAFAFGSLAGRIGAKAGIFLALSVYMIVSVVGYYMSTAFHFYLLAILVGLVQGGCQALSRSLFASMIPRHQSTQFFSFFAVCEKFAGIFGPAIFAGIAMATGSSRAAILAVTLFFVVGGVLLSFVNVEEGQRVVRETKRHS